VAGSTPSRERAISSTVTFYQQTKNMVKKRKQKISPFFVFKQKSTFDEEEKEIIAFSLICSQEQNKQQHSQKNKRISLFSTLSNRLGTAFSLSTNRRIFLAVLCKYCAT
jgi:peptide subunit release factor RF-3